MLQPHRLFFRSNSYTNSTCGLVTGTGYAVMLAELSSLFLGRLFFLLFFGLGFFVSLSKLLKTYVLVCGCV